MDNSVQGMKDYLATKEVAAKASAPEGMEFLGWIEENWFMSYTPLSERAIPVYIFKELENGIDSVQPD